jgi:hypothetical protein
MKQGADPEIPISGDMSVATGQVYLTGAPPALPYEISTFLPGPFGQSVTILKSGQFSHVAWAGGPFTVTYTQAFPNQCVYVVITYITNVFGTRQGATVTYTSFDRAGVTFPLDSHASTLNYFAIGY